MKRERLIQIARPRGESLGGKTRDEIEADVCESGLAQILDRAPHVICCVRASQAFQFPVIESLRAKARAVYP